MAICDLCGVVTGKEAKLFSPDKIKQAVKSGLRPPNSAWEGSTAQLLGGSKSEWLAGWIKMVKQDKSDWSLCKPCAAKVDALLTSTKKKKKKKEKQKKKCAHCGSTFYEPKTMKDKLDGNSMQKVRVGCSKCGTAVCFSCAATAADQRGKVHNCFCPKCGAELGRGGEAGELGEHFSGWN